MKAFWDWLTDDKNHRAVQLIATVLTGIAVGGWTLYTYMTKVEASLTANDISALSPALPAEPAPVPLVLAPLDEVKVKLLDRAADIYYFEDGSGSFSVDQALLLRENKIENPAQLRQFQDVLESDLRQCSESAAMQPGLAEKLAARNKCLDDKGYSGNTQSYLRAKYGLAN